MISLQKVVSFLVSILAFFTGLMPATPQYAPKDEENILLNAAVLSDLHSGPLNPLLQYNINKALKDASAAKGGSDAIVILGDNTMNGKETEYAYLYTSLALYAKADNLLAAVGNHDLWSGEGYEKERERFISYYNNFTNSDIDNVYYYKIINGYYFIVLGSESDEGTNSNLSNEQLAWLDGVLAEATADGKPAFVFNHMPMIRIIDSGRLMNVLNNYKNIFFFAGHMHRPLTGNSFVDSGNSLYFIDVPGFHGDANNLLNYDGHGWQIEAYADSVILRARNYIKGEWIEEFEYTLDLY